MAHYTVQSSSRQNQKMFRICGYSLMVLMLLFLGLSQADFLDDRWSHTLGWIAMSLLGLALIGVYVLIFKESMDKYWQKVSFDVVENKIVRVVDGQAQIEFPLNKISFIGESRIGLIVRGDEPSKAVVIPRAVEGFEQLRQQLSEHREVTPIKNKTSLVLILPLVLTIAVYALLFTAKTANLVLSAGAVALLFHAWAIVGMRKIWAKTSSPKLVACAFIVSWLILLWLAYQRFSSTL